MMKKITIFNIRANSTKKTGEFIQRRTSTW